MSIRSNVDPRRLDQRITFQRRKDPADQDEAGQPIDEWLPVVECWAAVDAEKASERILTSGQRSVAAFIFWIRADVTKRFDIQETDRIVWRDANYDVTDVLDQQLRGRMTAVLARTGLRDG